MSPLTGGSTPLYKHESKMESEKIMCNKWDKLHSPLLESRCIEDNVKTSLADCIKIETKISSSLKQDDAPSFSNIQDKTGGTIPKSTSVHGYKKSVRWAQDLTATVEIERLTIEDEEMKQISNLINCLRKERTFFKSPAFKAVSWMFDCDESMTVRSELAYVLLHLKHHREPTVKEMMGIIDSEPEMDERDFIGAIVDECESQGGVSVLESFLMENNIAEKQKCFHHDHFHEPLNMEDCLEKKTVEIPTLTKEEQIQRLKAKALKIEEMYLKNSLTCRQCKKRPVNTTFLPCGHVVLCSECSESCFTCPLCKQKVLGEVKTYLC